MADYMSTNGTNTRRQRLRASDTAAPRARCGAGSGGPGAARAWRALGVAAALLALGASALQAASIPVPNASFESPVTTYATPAEVDSWEMTAQPFWYDPTAFGAPWGTLIGLFANPAPGQAGYIDNCDGNQALWLFAVPEVGLFQDYDSIDYSTTVPTHAFNALYEVGKSYQLTVGALVGMAETMTVGATLELSLYYLDAASNQVTVAATVLTNTPNVFSNGTHFLDFTVNVPTVMASNAWAGQHIGIALTSTVPLEWLMEGLAGGYWDLDNVRLTSTLAPTLVGPTATNGWFGFALQSEPGQTYEILASSNLTAPRSSWASLGFVTNATGSVSFAEPATNSLRRFYSARRLP